MSVFTAEQLQEIKRIVALEVKTVQAPTPYDLRLNKGYHKISSLAKRAGVTPKTVRRYERGEVQCFHDSTYENFRLLATVLEVTPQEYSAAVQRRVDAQRVASR